MSQPPIDPRDRKPDTEPTWGGIAVAYGMMAAIPVLFAFLSFPVLATVTLAATGGVYLASRTLELYRCYRTCGGFIVDLGSHGQLCVGQPAASC